MQPHTKPSNSDGTKIRVPLDHPETDQLDIRMRYLLLSGAVTDWEAGNLIKKRRELRKLDYGLARRLQERSLLETSLRPLFWDDYARPMSGVFGRDKTEVNCGWVHRVREYIERLEAKHSICPLDPLGPGDDI